MYTFGKMLLKTLRFFLIIFSIVLIMILSGVVVALAYEVQKKDTIESNVPVEVTDDLEWADDSVRKYLEANKDRLSEVDGISISYMTDRILRNGKTYAMVKIGHSFEHRYVTDQWICIDSLTGSIFEYDVAADSLYRWSNQ